MVTLCFASHATDLSPGSIPIIHRLARVLFLADLGWSSQGTASLGVLEVVRVCNSENRNVHGIRFRHILNGDAIARPVLLTYLPQLDQLRLRRLRLRVLLVDYLLLIV